MFDYSGQMVKGYEINERIGAGSFGVVYRAYQPTIGREVAVKIILPMYANHPDFIRRFEAEAQLIARLEHPHIVPLFDYWREPEVAYLVMRMLPSSLRKRMAQGPLSYHEAAQITQQIASALAMSHRMGVVHRDVKPDNILLDVNGNAYLTDFGLATVVEGDWRGNDDRDVAGSPSYMAPEQLSGEAGTTQSDIYALGMVLYEMFMGTTPYAGLELSDLLIKKLQRPVPLLDLPPSPTTSALNRIIQYATAKDPKRRYTDIQDIARDFRLAVLGEDLGPLVVTDVEVENPYKGLRPFEEADAVDFFGRELLVDQLIEHLQAEHHYKQFLAVVGPSGSGKSSLVKAGLLPRLRRGALPGSDQWFIVTMVPGSHPLQQLETALLSVATHVHEDVGTQLHADRRGLVKAAEQILGNREGDLLLVIDQFEEVFTLVRDEDTRAHILTLLQTAVTDPTSRVRLIVSLRADFYDRPLLYENFGALIQARTHVVLPLTTSELERAIVAPAERVGVQVEPNLVAAIIADVHEEPGALPLLQYALTEVFERLHLRTMTLAGYEEIGRVAGALARRAARVYVGLTPVQRAVTQQVFLRLVTLGEGMEDTRRRVERSELASVVSDTATLQDVLDIFGRHRLLSFDRMPDTREPTVEVAHEALLREWGRLRGWLDESREDVRQQRRLARLTHEWIDAERDSSFLLRGVHLQQFEYWLEQTSISLSQEERAFMEASIEIREQRHAQDLARRERETALEARARQFLRGLLVMMFVALVIALGLSFLAFDQREEAHDARLLAEQNAERARVEAEVAAIAAAVAERRADELQSLALIEDADRAQTNGDIDLALALALQANQMEHPPVQAQRELIDVARLASVRVFIGHLGRVTTAAINPEGTLAVSAGDDDTFLVWDVATGAVMRRIQGQARRKRSVEFTPDGTQLVTGGDGGFVAVLDVNSGTIVREFEGHSSDVFDVAISPDGSLIASGSRDKSIIIWDFATGRDVLRLAGSSVGHSSRVTALAFSPDGSLLFSGDAGGHMLVWDVTSGEQYAQLEAHEGQITDVAVSPDGRWVVSASVDKTLAVWDTARYTVVYRLQSHTEQINAVAFSSDGRYIVSGAGSPFAAASNDNSVIVWDLERNQVVRRFTGHTLQITDVMFTPDRHYVLSASADSTLRLWDVGGEIEFARHSFENEMRAAAVTADGTAIVAALTDGRLVEMAVGVSDPTVHLIGAVPAVNAVAISPDGRRVLTASDERELTLWDVRSGDIVRTLVGHGNVVHDVVFSLDGKRAVSGSRDRSVIVWDVATGDIVRQFELLHTNSVNAVAINTSGTQVISAASDQTLIVWDIASGEALHTLKGHTAPVMAVAFSPDGYTAISGAQDKSLILWDVDSGKALRVFGSSDLGHTDWVTAVAFSPDGHQIWSGARDRSVIVWDVATAQAVRIDEDFDDSIILLAPDVASNTLIAGTESGLLRLLPVSTRSLIEWVETNRYIHPLTCDDESELQSLPNC